MKSLVLTANARLELQDRPAPEPPDPSWVLVRVAAAGVCGSDIPRAFENGAYHYPLVIGHEFSAVVERIGSQGAAASDTFAAGDRVAVYPLIPNPDEPINQIGEYALGTRYDYFGSRRDGAFSQLLWVPPENLFRVPDDVDLVTAAMTEPCAVAYHAVSRPRIDAGMSAAVLGGGPIGNMAAQWLRIRGCHPVIVSEPDERKRAIADELGFATVDPTREDPVDAIGRASAGGTAGSGGRGADVVVEAVGLPITFRQAIAAAGMFGQVVFLGNIHGDFMLPQAEFSSILRRELTIYGTWNSKITPRGSDEWSRVLAAMAATLSLLPLVSHRVPLSEGAAMLAAMHERSQWFNKVMIVDPELTVDSGGAG